MKIRVNNGPTPDGRRKVLYRAVVFAALSVMPLTILSYAVTSKSLFYLLYPGMVVGLLISGGHGGTETEVWASQLFGFILNVLVYSVFFFGVLYIRRHLQRAPHLREQ